MQLLHVKSTKYRYYNDKDLKVTINAVDGPAASTNGSPDVCPVAGPSTSNWRTRRIVVTALDLISLIAH